MVLAASTDFVWSIRLFGHVVPRHIDATREGAGPFIRCALAGSNARSPCCTRIRSGSGPRIPRGSGSILPISSACRSFAGGGVLSPLAPVGLRRPRDRQASSLNAVSPRRRLRSIRSALSFVAAGPILAPLRGPGHDKRDGFRSLHVVGRTLGINCGGRGYQPARTPSVASRCSAADQ